MAKAKEGRNKLFLEDWQRGLGNERLAEKYNLSIGGVKALKQRLRVKQTGQAKKKRSPEVTSTSTSTTTQTQTSTKRMTFWLTEAMIEAIKERGKKRGITASEILRQLLRKEKLK